MQKIAKQLTTASLFSNNMKLSEIEYFKPLIIEEVSFTFIFSWQISCKYMLICKYREQICYLNTYCWPLVSLLSSIVYPCSNSEIRNNGLMAIIQQFLQCAKQFQLFFLLTIKMINVAINNGFVLWSMCIEMKGCEMSFLLNGFFFYQVFP